MQENISKNNTDNSFRLYNLIFPLWMIVWLPGWWWLILIPMNFALDFFVLKHALKKKDVPDIKTKLKKCSWRVCLYGFLSDFIGAAFCLAFFILVPAVARSFDPDLGLKLEKWAGAAMLSCWNDIPAFLVILAGTALAALMIYLFNKRMLARRTDIGAENAAYCAKMLAIATAPYLFLIPLRFGG